MGLKYSIEPLILTRLVSIIVKYEPANAYLWATLVMPYPPSRTQTYIVSVMKFYHTDYLSFNSEVYR